MRTEGKKRITDKGFRKEVYFCKEPELEGTVVIQYRGDSSLSVPTSHGNSKIQTRIFVRTKPSVMTENDCGVYAIANMVSILHGVDPSSISFNVAAMRRHLLQGLENKKITVFPHRKLSFVKKACVKSYRHSNILYMSHARARLHVYMYRM